MTGSRGQAALELVVAVPLAVALALAVATAVSSAAAGVAAEHALDRGTVAAAGGADPVAAARRALPRGLAARSTVRVRNRVLAVRVDPAGPLPAFEARAVLP